MTLKGYAGKIAHVDLKGEDVREEPLDEELALNYLGGRGFVAKFLWDLLPRNIEPLSSDNILIVSTGILTGHPVPAANRTVFGAKSPLTFGYADSMMGGYFSPALKFAGYDTLILEHQATRPIYLLVTEEGITFEDANDLWGKGTYEVEQILKKKHSERCQISSIGPAGENQVPYACITHSVGRNAGREGIGAVMGFKNIKAIVAIGSKRPSVHDKEKLSQLNKEAVKQIREHPFYEAFRKYGTTNVIDFCNEFAIFPNRNFEFGQYDDHAKINGKAQREQADGKDKTCWGCPIGCWMLVKLRGKEDFRVHFAEYETTGMIGSNLELSDVDDLIEANFLCNDLGIDTVTTGSTIAFATECFAKKIITEKDTDGSILKFGSPKLLFELIRKIAHKEGFGAILAKGTKELANHWGKNSKDFAMQIKGNEMTAYESRLLPAMALSFMTADVGAHHNRSWAIMDDIRQGREKLEGKAKTVIDYQHNRPLLDQLGVCRFPWVETRMNFDYYAKFYEAITGIQASTEDLLKSSERVWNLTRCFWIREHPDFDRSWDLPPKRWTKPMTKGPIKGQSLTLENYNYLLNDYYSLRGWDANGHPTKSKIKELGLEFVLKELDLS